MCLIFSGTNLYAANVRDLQIDVSADLALEVQHYQADSNRLLIWLPSERGVSHHTTGTANAIADIGIDVWMVDLHGSYLLPPGRYSLNQFSPGDILKLIEEAELQKYQQVYFASASRGAELALKSIYLYSRLNPDNELLKGSILFYPNLFKPVTTMGQSAEFTEASANSHLPIYLMQAEYSTKFHFTESTRRRLESGGSRVFTHLLANVEAGFISRPIDDLSAEGIAARKRLPGIMKSAVRLMSNLQQSELRPTGKLTEQHPVQPIKTSNFQPYSGDKKPPMLKLKNLQGEIVDLADLKGRVVILNFWASWCKPCVDEIPSLSRLNRLYNANDFAILTVNTGESSQRVKKFIEPFDINFAILLDENGKAVRDWRVYAFPSNFLIDKNGVIRYGYRGALEWDSKEVLEIIETLL